MVGRYSEFESGFRGAKTCIRSLSGINFHSGYAQESTVISSLSSFRSVEIDHLNKKTWVHLANTTLTQSLQDKHVVRGQMDHLPPQLSACENEKR
jgi:hypothetical protein